MQRKTLPLLLIIQLALVTSLFSQTSEQLRANLYSFNTDSSLSLDDGNLTMYNIDNSNAVDGMDALKMANFGENFGLLRGAATLAIERRHSITLADTIFFKMWNMRRKNYKMVLYLTGLAHPGLTGFLIDKYLNTATALNLNGVNNAVFNITNDIASSASDRFKIIISLSSSSFKVLPVSFTGIKVYRENDNIGVKWTVENEKDIAEYQVEKSTNGRQFLPVASIYLKGKNLENYQWTDSLPAEGNNFYRINSINIDGKSQYSMVTKLSMAKNNYGISVFPNPVVEGSINLQLMNQPKGVYTARLINLNGELIQSSQLQNSGESTTQNIRLNTNTAKGNYILEIITPRNTAVNCKVLVQ